MISISALKRLKADFEIKDRKGSSSIDVMHLHGHTMCYAMASGQQPLKDIPSSPLPSKGQYGSEVGVYAENILESTLWLPFYSSFFCSFVMSYVFSESQS